MDWLDKTLNDYERKKAEKRQLEAEELKSRDEESRKNKQAAAEALGRALNKFQEVKKELVNRKYPCEVTLGSLTDTLTGEKFPNELTLLLKTAPLRGAETFSKLDASSLVLTTNLGSDQISITTKDIRHQREAPALTKIEIDMLTDDFIDTIIQKFINQIFI